MISLGADGGRAAVVTDAGMLTLWDPTSFHEIVDFDTWESVVSDEIEDHIDAGTVVCINDGSDGAYHVLARIGSAAAPAQLDEREARYQVSASGPHLFVSAGEAVISGIEYIRDDPDVGLHVELPAGRWSVVVARLDWEADPDSRDDDRRPSPTALPDFVLVINPADEGHAASGSR